MRHLDLLFIWIRRAAPKPWFWLGGPILIYLWTLGGPFLRDDLHLILKAERYISGETSDWQLFRFARNDQEWNDLRSRGTFPWWVPESGRLDYFRPIPAISFLIDTWLFGRWTPGHRFTSLLVFAFALASVRWMFMQTACGPTRAGAATFFFGISQTLAPPVTWVCNRSDLLALVGIALAAGCYWRAKGRIRPARVFVAIIAFAFALFCKESTIPLAGIIVLHECWLRRRPGDRAANPCRLVIAIAMLCMATAYLGIYFTARPWVATQAGTDGVPSQLGPMTPISLLLYVAVWTTGFPIDCLLALGDGRLVATIAVALVGGSLLILAATYMRRALKDDRAAAFFVLWCLLFMLPSLRSIAVNTRLLCTATLGWAYLLTGLILPDREEDLVIPRFLRHWYYAANGVVSICCAVGTILLMNYWEQEACERMREIVAQAPEPVSQGDAVVVAQARTLSESTCSGDRLEYLTGVRNVSFAYLLPPDITATATQEDDRTLKIRGDGKSLFGSALHALTLPADWRPRAGQMIHLRDFTVEISGVKDGGFVTEMRLHFKEPLGSPRIHLYPVSADAWAGPDQKLRMAQSKGS